MSDDETMRRTPGVRYEPDGRGDVLDFVVDYGYDSMDAGVDRVAVVSALREAADEIEREMAEPVTREDIYVWDHSTESVAEDGFDSPEAAETWADEHGPAYEAVDARPL